MIPKWFTDLLQDLQDPNVRFFLNRSLRPFWIYEISKDQNTKKKWKKLVGVHCLILNKATIMQSG